ELGMSSKLGHLTLGKKEGPVFLGRDLIEHKDYSDETARLIDQEVKKIVDEAYDKAKRIIGEHLDKLKLLATKLLEKEVLDSQEVKEIVGFENA
ncbi:MAG: cell division protein FtsH, partial [Candidatus Omnitrophica bacterium]|nr:cell division protein FtsH [Candidatus Omnitrophota bacterium]